jgi:hypothetical protein
MPGFNKTGPLGQGSQTGRRMGPCAENENKSLGFGLGRGRRRGAGGGFGFFGLGRRNQQSEDSSLENEIDFLKDQISLLEKRLGRKKNS